MKNIENVEEYDTLYELRTNVYNAEDMIDSAYCVGMYGDKFEKIDKLHTKVLDILSEYDELLKKILEL